MKYLVLLPVLLPLTATASPLLQGRGDALPPCAGYHTPPGVAVEPGTAADGHAVAPADMGGAPPAPASIDIPLAVPLSDYASDSRGTDFSESAIGIGGIHIEGGRTETEIFGHCYTDGATTDCAPPLP